MSPIKTFPSKVISLWQSAIHEVTAQRSAGATLTLSEAPPAASSDEPIMLQSVAAAAAILEGKPAPAVLGISDCAQLYVQLILAQARGNSRRVAKLKEEITFSTCDPLWALTLIEYQKFRLQARTIRYRRHQQLSDFVLPMPDKPDLRIGLIGDWGTGMEDARHLLAEVAQQGVDLVIHLGDIYYSGTLTEVQQNFLDVCRATLGAQVPVYTLTGNHDMYSGGAGYYWLIDQLKQPASYFGLRNAHWQLLGMDTGLHDSNPLAVASNLTYLEDTEVAWHRDKIAHAAGRKTVLLSHHQLFSAANSVGAGPNGEPLALNPKLHASFGDQLNQVALWAWGHEHNLALFEPYAGLARGRCIGSGAIPTLLSDNPYTPNPNLTLPAGQSSLPVADQRVRLGDDGEFYNHAYAILTLNGPDGRMSYYQIPADESGSQLMFEEAL